MGMIITTGNAEREVMYDRMTITLSFEAYGRQTRDVIRKVQDESEDCLKELKELGIDITKIEAGQNTVSRDSYRDVDNITARRTMRLDAVCDLKLVDAVFRLTEAKSYGVKIDTDYYVADTAAVENELIIEATEKAKVSAEQIAKALGTEITGVEEIRLDDEGENRLYCEGICEMESIPRSVNIGMYSELKKPAKTVTKEVYVKWLVK